MLTNEDRNAIDGLFRRLADAEQKSSPRDTEAEALIRDKIAQQPNAPYYLGQTVVVQQEALKQAERRLEELQAAGRQVEQRRGLWGSAQADAPASTRGYGVGGGGFLAGAMQTALGVAGGVMLGNLIGSMISGGSAEAAENSPDQSANSASDSPQDGNGNDPGSDAGGFDGGDFGGGDF